MSTREIVSAMADDLRPVIADIKANPPTTKDNYDQYYKLIDRLAGGNRTRLLLVVLALMEAGADREGVRHATKVAFPDLNL